MVYLDNAATTRTSPAAMDAMAHVMAGDAFANPSSQHDAGDAALRALEEARREVAACLRSRPSEVEWVSCGTEANNQALLTGAAYGAREGRRHIVASAIEHPSVLRMLERLASADGPFGGGFDVTLVRPDETGVVGVASVKEALREDTCLVSLMYANNEVGAIQPVRDVCRMCRKRAILFHTDAVQAAGHVHLDFARDGFDMLSVSAHKFHGPRGVGALLCSKRVAPAPLLLGDGASRVEALRARLVSRLTEAGGVRVLGPQEPSLRLPGIVALALEGVDHESALVLLDEAGVCVSAGSACAAGAVESSHVLAAMGVPSEVARTYLRVSIDATENDECSIDEAADAILQVAERLRGSAR